jgi:hypothetical protein
VAAALALLQLWSRRLWPLDPAEPVALDEDGWPDNG